MKPLAIDLFCGLGGWTDGLLAEGYLWYDWICRIQRVLLNNVSGKRLKKLADVGFGQPQPEHSDTECLLSKKANLHAALIVLRGNCHMVRYQMVSRFCIAVITHDAFAPRICSWALKRTTCVICGKRADGNIRHAIKAVKGIRIPFSLIHKSPHCLPILNAERDR